MKQLKIALLGIISTFILFLVFIPIKAEAASIIRSGSTIALKNYGVAPLYKMTLEKDSLVKVSWSNNKNSSAQMLLYTDSKRTKLVTSAGFNDGASGKKFFSLKKGVYYIYMYDNFESAAAPTTKVNFSWTPASNYNKENFCSSKAIMLNANTTESVVQTPSENYPRYYKIKLTREQKVQILTPYGNNTYIHIYSADWSTQYLTSPADETIMVTTQKLKAATYFVVIDECSRPYQSGVLGKYIAFKWK